MCFVFPGHAGSRVFSRGAEVSFTLLLSWAAFALLACFAVLLHATSLPRVSHAAHIAHLELPHLYFLLTSASATVLVCVVLCFARRRSALLDSAVVVALLVFLIGGAAACSGNSSGVSQSQNAATLIPTVTGSKPGFFATQPQGYATDGTYDFYSGTASLAKYDGSTSLWLNNTPFAGLSGKPSHIGDVEYYDGNIYAPVISYGGCPGKSTNQQIAIYSAEDGSLVNSVDVSSVVGDLDLSAVAVVPSQNAIYVVGFCNATALYKFDLKTLAFRGALSLSEPISCVQGLSYNEALGQFAVSADTDSSEAAGNIYLVSLAGKVTGPIYKTPTGPEGLDFTQGTIDVIEGTRIVTLTLTQSGTLTNN